MSPESRHASTSHSHWKLNWWDLWPIVDGEQRPIRWTPNSLILSPNPSSPVVVARLFPSSSSFSLPSPIPILNNPSGYSPPSVIEVSPSDDYVFAFFDGKGNDAVACIWHREDTIDTWRVTIFWHMKPGQGIVLAKWLGEDRMWLRSTPPTRAPPLGPNQFGRIALLLVNQSHTVQIVHRLSPSFPFQLTTASLRHASQVNTGDRASVSESTNGPGGFSVCVRAAIGMGYNEPSIIIATSSILIPPSSDSISEFSNPFGVAGSSPTTLLQPPWEAFGPERGIRLCEVKVTAYGFILGISTMPMPPIFPAVASSSRLTSMIMVPHLPSVEVSKPEGPMVGDTAASSKKVSGALLHIILSFIDLEDFSSPRSELLSFELLKKVPVGAAKAVTWSHHHITKRTITTSAVSFILQSHMHGGGLLLAGLLHIEGETAGMSHLKDKANVKEVPIGKVVMLTIPELEDDVGWEPSTLMTGTEEAHVDPPISAAVSPGGSLICTSPAACSGFSKLGVQVHPRQLNSSSDASSIVHMTESLLSTLLSDRPPTDVLHSLRNPALPLSSVIDVLVRTLGVLDCEEFSSRDWHSAMLGIMLDIFRSRSRGSSEENPAQLKDRAALDERWHVAMDMCSVKALVGAFEACKEGDGGYDLEPIWQLIGLSTWLVEFMERLLRSCVMWESDFSLLHTANSSVESQRRAVNGTDAVNVKMEVTDVDGNDLFDGELSPEPSPLIGSASVQLLHIFHPFTLQNLIDAVTHLNAFRGYLDALHASGLKAAIAKDVLMDVVDCSGVSFKELTIGLSKAKNELEAIDDDVLRRSFCSLTPLPSTYSALSNACKHVTSENAVSKARLFIKPADLVDGVSKLSLAVGKFSDDRDIVSKGVLGMPGAVRVCARCKGRTETGQTPLPKGKETSEFGRWAVWEHEWEKCICGGLWVRDRAR